MAVGHIKTPTADPDDCAFDWTATYVKWNGDVRDLPLDTDADYGSNNRIWYATETEMLTIKLVSVGTDWDNYSSEVVYTAFLASDPNQIIKTKSATINFTACAYTMATIDSFALDYASWDHKVYVYNSARTETFTFHTYSEPTVTSTLAAGCIT